jgi:DNA-binding SARP family transcriptional activator
MRFRVLGPLRVWDGSGWVSIRAGQERVVLAVLLAEAGRVVSAGRLIDEIWGQRPPRTAVNTVQVYVRRLRRALGFAADGPLVTRTHGYELLVGDGELDAVVFERMVASGRRALAEGRLEVAVAELAEALAFWQGPPLADVPPAPTVAAETGRLTQARLGALEDRVGAQLELGRHGEVVGDLQRLVDEHPLRERLRSHLMVALYRCGRRAEALEAYRHARDAMVDRLGLEPGPQLQRLQQAILVDDPELTRTGRPGPDSDGRPVPAQLPAGVAEFTGREAQLREFDALLGRVDSGALVIATIAGTAGVGKTALAVHWAHRVRDRFPDGQLYVNLRGHSTGPPLRPLDVLAGFLSVLGVPADEVPSDVDTAAALYRSLLAGRRLLVLLDDAGDPDQVRPLLPGGRGCLVLVTSRDRLGGLVAREGATRFELDALGAGEAGNLLSRLLGAERAGAEPAAVVELAGLCGYLPLALRIAAANLAGRPRMRIAEYAAALAGGDRLGGLAVDGDAQTAVRVAFDHSYAALAADTRRAWRMLGLLPGLDITAEALAALGGTSVDGAARLLEQLAGAHLVDEHHPGRYACHDLLRRYAADRAETEDRLAEREAALTRLYAHHLRRVDAAAEVLYPTILRMAPSTATDADRFADPADATAWLDAERANLVSAVRHTAVHGPLRVAWLLADGLRGYFLMGMHYVDWRSVAGAGLAAAEAAGDLRGQAAAQLSLGLYHVVRNHPDAALGHCAGALDCARRAGWAEGESAALAHIGGQHWSSGRLAEAAAHYTEALAIDRGSANLRGQANKLGNLGQVSHAQGRLALSAEQHGQALAIYRELGSGLGVGRAIAELGWVYHAQGRLDEAHAHLTRALTLHHEVGDRAVEAYTMCALAAVHRDAGRHDAARHLAEVALAFARQTGDRTLECTALITEAGVHHAVGDNRSAVDGFRRALDLSREIGLGQDEVAALLGAAEAHEAAGDLVEAEELAERTLALARTTGYRVVEGNALVTLALVNAGRGDDGRALELATAALAIHAETGHRHGLARAHQAAAEALRDGTEADTHRAQARVLFDEIGVPEDRRVRVRELSWQTR